METIRWWTKSRTSRSKAIAAEATNGVFEIASLSEALSVSELVNILAPAVEHTSLEIQYESNFFVLVCVGSDSGSASAGGDSATVSRNVTHAQKLDGKWTASPKTGAEIIGLIAETDGAVSIKGKSIAAASGCAFDELTGVKEVFPGEPTACVTKLTPPLLGLFEALISSGISAAGIGASVQTSSKTGMVESDARE